MVMELVREAGEPTEETGKKTAPGVTVYGGQVVVILGGCTNNGPVVVFGRPGVKGDLLQAEAGAKRRN